MQQHRRFRNGHVRVALALTALLTLLVTDSSGLIAQAPSYRYAHQLGVAAVSSSAQNERGHAMIADEAGNIYVTGSFNGTIDFDPGAGVATLTATDTSDAFVAKYDATGGYVWAFRLGGAGSSPLADQSSVGRGIDIDATGNIVVTGQFAGSGDFDPGPGVATRTTTANPQTFVAKYTGNGGFLWAFLLAGGGESDVEFDPTGNVFVVGAFGGTVDFDPSSRTTTLKTISTSTYLAKYSPSGAIIWVRKLGASGKNADWRTYPWGVSCDATGNVVLCGVFNGATNLGQGNVSSQGGEDLYVAKYSAAGGCIWAFALGGHNASDVAVDATGDVYLTGGFAGTVDFNPGSGVAGLTASGATDIYLAKYSSAGVYQWALGVGGGTSHGEVARSVAVDGQNDVLIAGHFAGTADFDPGSGVSNVTTTSPYSVPFVAKYTSTGAYDWAIGTDGSGGGSANAVTVSGTDVAITGEFHRTLDFDHSDSTTSLTSAGGSDIFVAGYGQSSLPRISRWSSGTIRRVPALD